MRCKKIVCLIVVLWTIGFAAATTVWNPAGNPDPNAIVDGVSNWNIAANWTNGLPGFGTEQPPLDTKAVFNVAGAAECIVTGAQGVHHLVMGDGGAAEQNNVLRIMDGGSITTGVGQWMSVGYNRPATLIVETGGVLNSGGHMWNGMQNTGVGEIFINGGTINVGQNFGLGWYNGSQNGVAHMYVNEGVLNLNQWDNTSSIWDGSFLDIRFGTVIIGGDRVTAVENYAAAGKILAFGGAGTLVYDYNVTNPGRTTITAMSALDPYPAYNQTILAVDVALAWTNLEPAEPGDSVWVDVWFGTDPTWIEDENDPNFSSYADFTPVVVAGENTTTVMVNAPVIGDPPTTYYWKVDSYLYGDPAIVDYETDPNFVVVKGDVYKFDVTNILPPLVNITTPPTITWKGVPIQLATELVQGEPTMVAYEWTTNLDDPNIVFTPSNTDPNPTVTVDYHSGPFTVTVTVDDGLNVSNSASVQLDCADNPCQAARAIGRGADYPGDIPGALDCKVNLDDFARIASQWLTDYSLTAPVPLP